MAKQLHEEHRPVVMKATQNIPGTEFYKMWNIGLPSNYKAEVPIFNVYNMHGLNAIIGYAMLINSKTGKVLYRGQAKLHCGENGSYRDLLPSICHIHTLKGESTKSAKRRWDSEFKGKSELLDKQINAIIGDSDLLKQVVYNFDFNDADNRAEMQVVIESLLQHYGASTRCMDFVDNHWIALWFGLYQWVLAKKEDGKPVECFYKKRPLKLTLKARQDESSAMRQNFLNELEERIGKAPVSQSRSEISKLLKQYSHKLALAEDQFLYLILYVANTLPEYETTQHAGVYTSPQMTVVDLRRALPSVFLRPGAQHGWTVKNNSTKTRMNRGDHSFAQNVVAILRIPLSLADELIGGSLLSQENLFPPADYDQGYRILLQRQNDAINKKDNLTELDKALQHMPITRYI